MFRFLLMTSPLVDVIWHIPVTAQKSADLTDRAEEAWSLLCRKFDVRLSSESAAVCRRRGQRFTLLFASTSKTDNRVVDILSCEWLCAVEVSIAFLSFCKLNPCGFHFFFTVVPCILILSKFYYQLMHKRIALKRVIKFIWKLLQYVSM